METRPHKPIPWRDLLRKPIEDWEDLSVQILDFRQFVMAFFCYSLAIHSPSVFWMQLTSIHRDIMPYSRNRATSWNCPAESRTAPIPRALPGGSVSTMLFLDGCGLALAGPWGG